MHIYFPCGWSHWVYHTQEAQWCGCLCTTVKALPPHSPVHLPGMRPCGCIYLWRATFRENEHSLSSIQRCDKNIGWPELFTGSYNIGTNVGVILTEVIPNLTNNSIGCKIWLSLRCTSTRICCHLKLLLMATLLNNCFESFLSSLYLVISQHFNHLKLHKNTSAIIQI